MSLLETPQAGSYTCLYADPPWEFRTFGPQGQNGKGASGHYRVEPITELGKLPVSQIAAQNAWLFMWTTWPHLQDAFELARLWSDPENPWRYRTGGAWAKRPRGWRGDPMKWQMGTGYIFRSACEPLLVFGRGYIPWTRRDERNLWVEPVRAHSQKPEAVRDMIRRATPRPRLELFANDDAEGFDRWGDGHERKFQPAGR